ncbi:hypothetical protein BGZ67_007192 [Mortierella alpina]|nr:hypothetical protein BGZ67_007192 [Mortierella alpina]
MTTTTATNVVHTVSTLSATPLFYRSLSAPSHMQLSELSQNGLMPAAAGQMVTSLNHDYFCHPSPQQQQQQQQQHQQQQHSYHNNPTTPMTPSHSHHHHHHQQQGFAAEAQFFVPHTFPLNHAPNGLPISYLANNNHAHNNSHNNNSHNSNNNNGNSASHYTYQAPVHPFQMDVLTASQNSPDAAATLASPSRVKYGFPTSDPLPIFHAASMNNIPQMTSTTTTQDMDDVQANASISYSPSSSSLDGSSPTFQGSFGSSFALRSAGRVHSLPFSDNHLSRFDLPEDYMECAFPRHASLGSLCLDTQSHELLEASLPTMGGAQQYPYSHPHLDLDFAGTAMAPSLSSSSISSDSSLPSPNDVNGSSGSKQTCGVTTPATTAGKPKLRRASTALESPGRLFTCIYDDCGKLFKRSEHLKRHVRSLSQKILAE